MQKQMSAASCQGDGSAALYLPGEVEGGVAAELQHVLQLLRGGGNQRD